MFFFLLGAAEAVVPARQNEQTMDASAQRAEDGRGTATISVGERLARIDPTIS